MKVLLDVREGTGESGGGKCDWMSAPSDGDGSFPLAVQGVASGDPIYDARVCSGAVTGVRVLRRDSCSLTIVTR